MLAFVIILFFGCLHPSKVVSFNQVNSSLPLEYVLREKLVRSGCWPLNSIPDVFPVLNRTQLPLKIIVIPYFEIVTTIDDKMQT